MPYPGCFPLKTPWTIPPLTPSFLLPGWSVWSPGGLNRQLGWPSAPSLTQEEDPGTACFVPPSVRGQVLLWGHSCRLALPPQGHPYGRVHPSSFLVAQPWTLTHGSLSRLVMYASAARRPIAPQRGSSSPCPSPVDDGQMLPSIWSLAFLPPGATTPS